MATRQLLLFLPLLFFTNGLLAQTYFQQKVDYQIDVRLDDQKHELLGFVDIEYTNNAPVALDTLYFHLWPNAYRNRETAFAKQLKRRGEKDFLFAEADQLGRIDSIDFRINDKAVDWGLHPEHIDIAILLPEAPIAPGKTVAITTPFSVQLPYCFSRLGHVDQAYQITQWYPKPAVYDQDGWHPMPYLDMGEFYSEFGDFEVSITLPANYLVAATGVLQTPSEEQFLKEQIELTNKHLQQLQEEDIPSLEFPPSSEEWKTITYTAASVHDFAWFADKRFMVQTDSLQLAGGKTVDCWAFFTQEEQELWQKATDYIKRSVRFYSSLVGPYPYPQATAVQTALGAGGGMEYPMITNCGLVGDAQSLDGLIAHEVGHNWFYGILASNERTHPWMDEGLNSYYDHRYSRTFYDEDELNFLPDFLFNGSPMSFNRLAYLYQARRRMDQAPDTHSNESSEINYFLGAYEKPAQALHYLAQYVGQQQFDIAMQDYYQKWTFKHPQPEDFQAGMEASLNRPLDWLFDGLLYSDDLQDYGFKKIERTENGMDAWVTNKGEIAGPFTLTAMAGQDTIFETWVDGFSGTQKLSLPQGEYSHLIIDKERLTLDINRQDNQIKTSGPFKKVETPRVSFFTAVEDDTRSNLYWLPLPYWNNYDKLTAGLALYNTSIPAQKMEWYAVPSYSFGSKAFIGLGDIHYNWYPDGAFLRKISLGLNVRSYHYRLYAAEDELLRYTRWQPYLRFQLESDLTSNLHKELSFRNIWLQEEQLMFDNTGTFTGTDYFTNSIQEARYTVEKRGGVNDGSWSVALEHQAYDGLGEAEQERYLKASVEWQQEFHFGEKQAFWIRLFAGGFLHHTERDAGYIAPGAFNLISQGYNDYRYDGLYFGRTDNSGIWSQQVSLRDGGFKNAIGQGFALGRSNNFIISANLTTDLPANVLPWLPIKPYFDIGYFDNTMPTGSDDTFQDQLLWSGGLSLSLIDQTAVIYFPLISSQNLANRQAERGNYWQRISFLLDLQRLNPWRMVDRLEF